MWVCVGGKCGINGMGTWVVSTICCAAEVESQRFRMDKNCQTRESSRGCGVVVSAHWIPGDLGHFGRAVAVVALVV